MAGKQRIIVHPFKGVVLDFGGLHVDGQGDVGIAGTSSPASSG